MARHFAYGASVRTDDPDDVRRAVERSNRNDVEQRIWSITLGLPQEELAAVLGVPDVQFTWPKTGTTVNEPPRLSRRLHTLRGWSNGNTDQVFSGSSGAGGADGARAPA